MHVRRGAAGRLRCGSGGSHHMLPVVLRSLPLVATLPASPLSACRPPPPRADPFVEVGLSEKGEHLLGAAGEVHLETVVKDLRERFARVSFQV